MSRARSLLRLLAVVLASLAVSLVPVARAFADNLSKPTSAAAMAPSHRAATPVQLAHRMPRLRKPKQSLFAMLPGSRASQPVELSARRRVPPGQRLERAASFVPLPDHPPA